MAQPQPLTEPSPPPDADLIVAWRGRDEQAAAELVRRHARALARFLAGAGAPEADLDDLVQDTFIRAFRAVDRFRGQCQLHLAADDRRQRAEGSWAPRGAAQSGAA